jgi:hypothetical protein
MGKTSVPALLRQESARSARTASCNAQCEWPSNR